MPVYHLPAKQEVADALAEHLPVIDRLTEVAIAAGYIIGEGGIQAYPDGSVTIDSDRDPTDDWLSWNPEIPTQQETDDAALWASIVEALTELQQIGDVALGATGAVTPAQLVQMRTAIGRLARIQEGTIRALVKRLHITDG